MQTETTTPPLTKGMTRVTFAGYDWKGNRCDHWDVNRHGVVFARHTSPEDFLPGWNVVDFAESATQQAVQHLAIMQRSHCLVTRTHGNMISTYPEPMRTPKQREIAWRLASYDNYHVHIPRKA